MPSPANLLKVSFTSQLPIDKIVFVQGGTFDAASDVSPVSRGTATIRCYLIPHGFPRPLFVDLLWSFDGQTWIDGGTGTSGSSPTYSLAFCDSTNINIIRPTSSGTIHYRVIGYWIDNYDNTNPVVPSYFSSDKSKAFDSRTNYQKIYRQGEILFTPNTSGSFTTTNTVSHDLEFIPNARVFYEKFSGDVWPGDFGGAANPFDFSAFAQETSMDYKIYNTQLEIDMFFAASYVGGNRRVWYRIYADQ